MKAFTKLGVIAALGLTLAAACTDGGGETASDLAGSAGPDASNASTGAVTDSGGLSSGRASTLSTSGPFQPGQTSVTVDGYGRATAPVDTVILRFALVLDPGFDPIGTPCPPDQSCPASSVRPPASPPFSEDDLDPVLAAINQQGITDDQVTVIGRGAAAGAEIYVAVSDPRQLGPVVNVVGAATQASDRVALLSGAGISKVMSVEQCRAVERRALDGALADARRRAQSMVEGFDVVVGEVVSVEERPTRPPCSLYEAIFDDEIGFRLPVSSYTLGQGTEETVVAEVSVTFAVQ